VNTAFIQRGDTFSKRYPLDLPETFLNPNPLPSIDIIHVFFVPQNIAVIPFGGKAAKMVKKWLLKQLYPLTKMVYSYLKIPDVEKFT
jgi:hypothetical protein